MKSITTYTMHASKTIFHLNKNVSEGSIITCTLTHRIFIICVASFLNYFQVYILEVEMF